MNGTNASPFDKPFYLILNVAVGGTNGWFPDGIGDKPWFDGSLSTFLCLTLCCASSHCFTDAMQEFAKNQAVWSETWPTDDADRGMVVDSVKMWQKC